VLSSIPSIPTIPQSLIGEVSQAPERVDLNRVVDLIGRDQAIAAQCLRLANSPLMGRVTRTDSVRGAVHTLGISHICDIAFSTMCASPGH
jgi:HD-like signal output (HDOD) protein